MQPTCSSRLRDLAAEVGLSPSMLSQIESNSVNPSINTLKNIAEALHVPMFQFFKYDVRADQLIVRKGENRIIGHAGEEVMYKLLTPDISGAIEFCLMEIPAGTASSDVPSGEVDLHLNGTVYHLQSGDAVRMPPMSGHRWVNTSDEELKAVFAITPPSF